MQVAGRASVSRFLDDCIVFRNLNPVEERLPRLEDLQAQAGLQPGRIPRKSDPEYAQVIVHLLRRARALDAPHTPLSRLIYLGDTRMSDGAAFANLCQAGGWPGAAFIGSETEGPLSVASVLIGPDQFLFLANRWSALNESGGGDHFTRFLALQRLIVDESTAVVIDLDKTAIGARGRNAGAIDGARLQAVQETVADLLGSEYDDAAFRRAYQALNQVEFHPFTADNQDYLAYICLILGSGLEDLNGVMSAVRAGQLRSFEQFIQSVEERHTQLPAGLGLIHAEIYANVLRGDPTPFKAFRRNEYRCTVGRMGFLKDDVPVEKLLQDEIVLTREVMDLALAWKARGALLFGLSDKPDEASLPSEHMAQHGFLPIHRTETHVVGE